MLVSISCVSWQVFCSRASSAHLMGPCWVAGTTAAAAVVEASELPSCATGAASDPEGAFTTATWVDLGRESSSEGLDSRSCHVAHVRGELGHVGQMAALARGPSVSDPV